MLPLPQRRLRPLFRASRDYAVKAAVLPKDVENLSDRDVEVAICPTLVVGSIAMPLNITCIAAAPGDRGTLDFPRKRLPASLVNSGPRQRRALRLSCGSMRKRDAGKKGLTEKNIQVN